MLGQIGAFALPALLPAYMARWHLTATEAGWLISIFFAAYVVAVPLLLALTDRIPVKRIYLVGTGLTAISHIGFALVANGFWAGLMLRAVAGIGWAGTYMTGPKALADHLDTVSQSRAVSWHAAGVGISGAGSFAIAGGMAALGGPEAAFLLAAVTAACAFVVAALIMPSRPAAERSASGALLDYRPVFRNRAAMAWIAGYTVHTWEMAVVRGWAVVFFTTVIAWHGSPWWLPDPTVLFTIAGLAVVLVSVTGNETAQRWGRRQVVVVAMTVAAALSLIAGWTAAISTPLAVIILVLWNAAIYLDSSVLTAGTVQAADPKLRGATMGLHSMCGYAGGFVGPPVAGSVLGVVGHDTVAGWGIAFGHLAVITLTGFAMLLWLSGSRKPRASATALSAPANCTSVWPPAHTYILAIAFRWGAANADPEMIYNWRRLDSRITTSGQPTEAQLAENARSRRAAHRQPRPPHP
jgi:MFS family permease